MAKPEPPAETPATGIDYLALLAEDHEADLNRLAPPTRFAGLIETSDPDQMPGQLQLPTTGSGTDSPDSPDTDESDRP